MKKYTTEETLYFSKVMNAILLEDDRCFALNIKYKEEDLELARRLKEAGKPLKGNRTLKKADHRYFKK